MICQEAVNIGLCRVMKVLILVFTGDLPLLFPVFLFVVKAGRDGFE